MNNDETEYLRRPRDVTTSVDTLPELLMRLSSQGRLVAISDSATQIFAINPSACLGKTPEEIGLPLDAITAYRSLVERHSHDQQQHRAEFSVVVNGREHHFVACSVADFKDNLPADSFFIVTHDITRCIDAEIALKESLVREKSARDNADAAARSRDQFLGVVSHELRSPLNGIQSWTHVLESQLTIDQPIVKRAFTGIKTGVAQQVRLIEGLLDATLIMSGKLNLLSSEYHLNDVAQAALDSLRNEAADKSIKLNFDLELEDDGMYGDPVRMQQVIWNLISNGIKFTDSGGLVRLVVSRDGGMAVVAVEDNGAGVDPQSQASLFEPFQQVDNSRTRRAAGLGVGLAVSRRIVEMHGGRIVCNSEGVGHGSTFHVFLPLPG